MAANASLLGAKTTYGPFSSTGTMLIAGLAPPETNALNVEMSGMLAITLPTGWSAKLFQLGRAVLNASQPGPCGSGTWFNELGSGGGSAYAVPVTGALSANGTDAAIAAIPAAAPHRLLARVFNVGSFVRSHRMLKAANAQFQSRSDDPITLQGR